MATTAQLRFLASCVLVVTLLVAPARGEEKEQGGRILFNRDIRPILADNCFACHGPDKNRRKSGLRLDDPDQPFQPAKSGDVAVVRGKPEKSALMARVLSTDAEEVMPPPKFHKTISPGQKELLRKWIAQGAEYQPHWSYISPVKARIPDGANGVDFLVGQRLATLHLASSPEADRRTLARRLYFDLLGLPPKPEDVDAFVKDSSPQSWQALVDRLLSLPHYGERMAVGWLDIVRYADTVGYHSDVPRNVWPYRDWVIRSFNENKRFDRFTIEQIAGDLLPDASEETRVGSAFNRLLLTTEEGGAQPKDYEARMLADRVRAIGTAWLGQTTGCAQCHDHKFDPFTTRDFYSLGAFFADIQEPAIGKRGEGLLLKAASGKEKVHCLVSIHTDQKRIVRILPRGNWMDETGEVVKAALPHYLPQPKIEGRDATRLDLGRWLVSRENPLTARVFVNRLWKQFFGIGLSRVLEDLGAQGEPPVNPELLDWLACEFMDSGWDVKHLVRIIATSRAYRQSSIASNEAMARDPYNRETARQSRFRLDAELVRDNALAISGLLSPAIGGPSVKPYQPDGYWENLNFPARKYIADTGANQYRRGLYTWWQRTFPHPSLLAFDAPSREECCAERNRSNLPQQALVLLNDPTYVEASRSLATRILTECSGSTDERIAWAWRQALQRPPRSDEFNAIRALLKKQLAEYAADPKSSQSLLNIGLAPTPPGVNPSELAAWTNAARVLLNLHETITRS